MNDERMPITQALYGKKKRRPVTTSKKPMNPQRTFTIASQLSRETITALRKLCR